MKGTNIDPSPSSSNSTPHTLDRRHHRPRSTPGRGFRISYADIGEQQRPKTASLIYQNCERLGVVERESVRQHKMRPHLPTRRDKPAPWQAQLEGTQKPVHVSPGYILSRSKSKYQMIINDKFFEMQDAKSKNQQQAGLDPEIELMINNLKQQVADLNLHLEEERLNHKETKRKAEDFLQDKVTEMRRDQKEAMRRLVDEHTDLMNNTIANHEREMSEQSQSYEAIIGKNKTEMAFLQGAFESYKSQSETENQKALKELEAKLSKIHEELAQSQLRELVKKMTNEKNAALAVAARERTKALAALEKQCSKDIEALNRRYANHAADIKKLKEMEEKKEELEERYQDICERQASTEKQLTNALRERADYKGKLAVFESNFEERVRVVDGRYKGQIGELRRENTELRKQYMSKCDQLYAVTAESDRDKYDQMLTSKQAMKALIESRSNAYVSIAAKDPRIKQSVSKERPCSAPTTRKEEYSAVVSAGETDEFLARKELPFVRPQSILELSAVFDTKELNTLTNEELQEGLVHAPDY